MFLQEIKSKVGFAMALVGYLLVPVLALQESAPVCPTKSAIEIRRNYPYVVVGRPPKCYVAGRQGPCSKGMVLFEKPRSHQGICSCACFLKDGTTFDETLVRHGYRYCFDPNSKTGTIFAYDRSRAQCYNLGSRGPCPPGEVFKTNILDYNYSPKCVKEDVSSEPHTPIEKCPPGTIYSDLLQICTDMNFHGLARQNESSSGNNGGHTGKPCNHNNHPTTTPSPTGTCPTGTIYSTLLNMCTDMSFTGLPPTTEESATATTGAPTGSRCPPGTIYSTLLNICTDMNFKGLGMGWGQSTTAGTPTGSRCPPGTIYSTLLNICTDMNFKGLGMGWGESTTAGTPTGSRCPPGTIYSTLLNICTDMNFKGLGMGWSSNSNAPSRGKCPPGTIYSTLLNICTDMNFKGLTSTETPEQGRCPQGTIYSTLLNRCTDMNFRGAVLTNRL